MTILTHAELQMKIAKKLKAYLKSRGYNIHNESYMQENMLNSSSCGWRKSNAVGTSGVRRGIYGRGYKHAKAKTLDEIKVGYIDGNSLKVIKIGEFKEGEKSFLIKEKEVSFREPDITQARAENIFKAFTAINNASNQQELIDALEQAKTDNGTISSRNGKFHKSGSWLFGSGTFRQSNAYNTLEKCLKVIGNNKEYTESGYEKAFMDVQRQFFSV